MIATIRSEEVLVADGSVVQVTAADVAEVVRRGTRSSRKRARLCTHPNASDSLHEMLICLARGTYVRPHRHTGKSESFHIIEGEFDVVLFHDDGSIREVICMGPYHSGKTFFYRLMEPCFHTVLVKTPHVLFHETTNGPFNAADSEFAPWSPVEGDSTVPAYLDGLRAMTTRDLGAVA
ncbi:MAG: WbuC family cupin fold metalloprotein [Planctomycetes bacterium]|nr:WbuC family cupin fold metalloprotein [Planctomycetota bacterium]